jgi:hypothetical protein
MDLPFEMPGFARGLAEAVVDWAAGAGLELRAMGALGKYAGSQHWHLKRPRRSGTIELTLIPAESRGWFSMRPKRACNWTIQEVQALRDTFIIAVGTLPKR